MSPLALLTLLLFQVQRSTQTDPCSMCTSNPMNGTETFKFCEDNHLKIQGRCCHNGSVIVGIDLHDCGLTEQKFESAIKGLTHLKYLSIEENSKIQNVSASDFGENSDLIYLSLPKNMECPGGSSSWKSEEKGTTKTVCHELLNPCDIKNVTCPENSHCEQAGITATQCLCDEGFHGYKCMNEGSFPLLPFIIGLVVPSIALTALLYITQRRYVVKKQN